MREPEPIDSGKMKCRRRPFSLDEVVEREPLDVEVDTKRKVKKK